MWSVCGLVGVAVQLIGALLPMPGAQELSTVTRSWPRHLDGEHMPIGRRWSCFLVAGALVVFHGCSRAPEKLTPEAARAKGNALLKEMSKNLGALQTFAYSADERREEMRGGTKVERHLKRRVTMRRPSALTYTSTADDRSGAAWYDGKHLTLSGIRTRPGPEGPMPPTLDEALDFLNAEYAIQMPTADLLYSSPYDALMTPETTGGWVDIQKVGDRSCDHLVYQQKAVDWEIWLSEAKRLPCQVADRLQERDRYPDRDRDLLRSRSVPAGDRRHLRRQDSGGIPADHDHAPRLARHADNRAGRDERPRRRAGREEGATVAAGSTSCSTASTGSDSPSTACLHADRCRDRRLAPRGRERGTGGRPPRSGGSVRQSRNVSSGANRSNDYNRNVNRNTNVNRNVNVTLINRNVNVNRNVNTRAGYGRGGAVAVGEEGAVAVGRRGVVAVGEDGAAAVGRRGAVAVGEEGFVGVGRYGAVVGGERYESV